jgi:cation:H+ antiporter
MFEAIGFFLFGVFLLLLGGDSMVRGVSGLGQRLGLSPFLAGFLLLSIAASLPDLAVNAYALRHGRADMALGNAIGGNIAGIGLVLALAAIAAPLLVRLRVLAAEVVFVLVATGAVLLFGFDGVITQVEGGLLLLGFVGVLIFVFRRARGEPDDVRRELEKYAHTGTGFAQNLARIAIGAAVLFFGSKYVVTNATLIGQALGVGAMFAGLTVVAAGTALPKLAMALLAARQGQGNVVVGQVLGSCLFNLLFVVGGMALVQPLAVPATLAGFEVPVAMAFGLALYPLLAGDARLGRREGGILLASFVAWLAFESMRAWR